jgi:hypothetical protein
MRYLGLLFSILMLFGCTSTKQIAAPKYSISLKSNMTYEAMEDVNEGTSMQLDLGVIPGAIYGSPLKSPRWLINLNDNLASNLDIAKFEIELNKAAKVHDTSLPFSLNISPSDTKLVRVSTFGFDPKNNTFFGSGFQNKSNEYILLVYFDKACSMSGSLNFENQGIFNHEIEIPKAGIYALVISGSGNNKTVKATQLSENLNVLFF